MLRRKEDPLIIPIFSGGATGGAEVAPAVGRTEEARKEARKVANGGMKMIWTICIFGFGGVQELVFIGIIS